LSQERRPEMRAAVKTVDLLIVAGALVVWSYAWAVGYQDWVGATSVVLVPLYLLAHRHRAA